MNSAPPFTHKELVQRAVYWLLGRGGCSIAFSEFSTASSENPDAIGWAGRWSVLVECKVSRSDFLRDRHKPFRRGTLRGIGQQRWFMVPAGLVSPDELPDKWGLLYAHNKHIRIAKKPGGFTERDYLGEIGFLTSMLRRVEIRAIAAHYAAGNETRPTDYLNQWIKTDRNQKVLIQTH